MTFKNVWLITKNTFRGTVTGRWLILFATVFLLIIINIPLLFLISNTDVNASFLNAWVPYLIDISFPFLPLLALPVGAPMIVEERELGILQFTLSNPVSKMEYLSGKILGLLIATTMVILAAFGLASATAYGTRLSLYSNIILVVVSGSALNVTMVALATTISLLTRRKTTAMGIGLFVWFLLTTISDLGLMSIIVNLNYTPWVTTWLVLLNPVEVGSVLASFLSGVPVESLSSTALSVHHVLLGSATFVVGLMAVIWIVVMVAICYAVFLKQDI